MPLNQLGPDVSHQEVDTAELQRGRDLMSGEQRVAGDDWQAAEEPGFKPPSEKDSDNRGRPNTLKMMDDIDDLDEEEMKRIEKILK